MRHTIHQFCKEFRFLRVRWCVLLAVLLLDLTVQMEWVLPMRPLEYGHQGAWMVSYDILMRLLLWMVIWWFMLSVPPEEGRNDGRGYAQTRPLSRTSYWGARLLVWLLLVMVPLMLESAVYLKLNGRPWSEAGLGMAERVWAAGSMTLWLLPLPLLLRGWERYAVIVMVILSVDSWLNSVIRVVFRKMHWVYDAPYMAMEFGRSVQAAWLVGLLMPVLVLWHQRRPLGMLARLAAVMVLVTLEQGVAASVLFRNAYEKASAPEMIRRLTAGREVMIPERDRHFAQEDDRLAGKYISLRANARLKGMPEEYVPGWRATSIVMTQNGQVLPVPAEPEGWRRRMPLYGTGYLHHNYPMADAPPGAKLEGLLSVGMEPDVTNMQVRLPQPVRLDAAVDAHVGLKAEWMRVHRLGELPLKAGAKYSGPHFEMELLKVKAHENGRGERTEGCVTVVCRMSPGALSGRTTCGRCFHMPSCFHRETFFVAVCGAFWL